MGCCSSRRSSSSSTHIRVVDVNGLVQDFDYPVTVRQLIKKPKTQFVSTPDKLLSSTGSMQLHPDTQLEPGKIYFLLPSSTFKHEVSPMDLLGIVKRLSSIAKSTRYVPSSNNYNNNTESATINTNQDQKRIRKRCLRRGDKSWKPILDPIREKSFTRRSESELSQEIPI